MRGTPFNKEGFTGGLNTVESPYSLEDTAHIESPDCLNVVPTLRGAIRKRNGSTTFSPGPAGAEVLTTFPYNISGTKGLLIHCSDGKLYNVTSGGALGASLASGLSTTQPMEFVQAPTSTGVAGQGPVYGVDGTNARQYNGTTVATWTGVNDAQHYQGAGNVPVGKYMVFNANRIWMAGVSGDPSAVFFSDLVISQGAGLGDPSSWPLTNIVRFDSADGYPITGLGVVGPYILVFKEKKSWVINDINTGANRKVDSSVGCVSHRSIVTTERGCYFLTADQGVFLTNGLKHQEVSYNVRPTILGINQGARTKAAGGYINGHYYLSFPSGASTTNTLTLDYDEAQRSWWLHDLCLNQWVPFDPTGTGYMLYGGKSGISNPNGLIVQAWVPGVYTDSGSVYTGKGGLAAYWRGPWHVFGYYIFRHFVKTPFIKKRVRQIFFDGSGVIQPYIWKDFAGAGTAWTAQVQPGINPPSTQTSPVNFGAGAQQWANPDVTQLWAGTTYQGAPQLWGGGATVLPARLYALGVANAWAVQIGNNTADPFEMDSYSLDIQFRKS